MESYSKLGWIKSDRLSICCLYSDSNHRWTWFTPLNTLECTWTMVWSGSRAQHPTRRARASSTSWGCSYPFLYQCASGALEPVLCISTARELALGLENKKEQTLQLDAADTSSVCVSIFYVGACSRTHESRRHQQAGWLAQCLEVITGQHQFTSLLRIQYQIMRWKNITQLHPAINN